jgi:hypothetical protein
MGESDLERTGALLAVAAGDGEPLAVGWATVEIERATVALARSIGFDRTAFAPAADSTILGARCLVAAGVLPGGLALAVLEPVTEGRLAGALARLGEGPVAVWSCPVPGGIERAVGAPVQPGPFGPERAIPSIPRNGPFRFLITRPPGTIRT